MLKKTTSKLAFSLLGASVISVILSLVVVLTFGSLSAKSVTSSGTADGASSAVSSSSTVSEQSNTSSSLSATQSLNSESGFNNHTAGKVFSGVISILIYTAIIYSAAWQEGSKDPNRVKYGHMNKFMAKGLVAGLLASIPYAVLTTAFVISQAISQGNMTGMVINTVYRLINIQYIVFGDGYLKFPIVCFLLLLALPAVSAVGYIVGYHKIALISKIIYKNQKKSDGTYRKGIIKLKR